MPQYIIKTVRDRNLVIEADRYNYNPTEETYEFFKKTENADTLRVATVGRSSEILAIVETNAEKADFYDVYDLNAEDNEDECDDTCLDCRLDEFLTSPEFRERVFGLIDAFVQCNFHDGKFISETEAGASESEPSDLYPIEHWKDRDGNEWWGFHTDKGFVNCWSEDFALTCRQHQIDNLGSACWSYLNLTGATRLED